MRRNVYSSIQSLGWSPRLTCRVTLPLVICGRRKMLSGLVEIRIIVRIRRGAAAEEAEGFVGGDLVPGVAGNEDGIARGDLAGFAVEFHEAATFEDEIE